MSFLSLKQTTYSSYTILELGMQVVLMAITINMAMDTPQLLLMDIMMIMLKLMDTDMVIIMKIMCMKPLSTAELSMSYPPSMTLTRSCQRRLISMRDSCSGFQPDGKLIETMS